MRILVLDNYDSFTYNLVHIIRQLGHPVDVIRNDHMAVEEVDKYDKVLFSPGPGIPDEAGIMKEVIRAYAPTKSMLGVCLGHQGIGEVFGAQLYNMPIVRHGVTSEVCVEDPNDPVFRGIPASFEVCLYHSWAIEATSVPEDIRITARDQDGVIMGISHSRYDIRGLQFHPESILTQHGIAMVDNWLKD